MSITALLQKFYLELSQVRIVGAGMTLREGMKETHLPSCCISPV